MLVVARRHLGLDLVLQSRPRRRSPDGPVGRLLIQVERIETLGL